MVHRALNLVGVLSLCPDRAVERFASVALDALDASDGTSVTAAVTADYLRASYPWLRFRSPRAVPRLHG